MFLTPILTAGLLFFSSLAQANHTVQFGNTTLLGSLSNNVEFYGGILYAEPPLGNLRFLPSMLKSALGSPTFNASSFGVACLQEFIPSSSEDCLTINVFRPAGLNGTESLPVMAFIYGGGFLEGVSSLYPTTAIVAQSIGQGTPVIYVSFNYRVGVLGFPPGREALARDALNLGLKDQLAALQWIQDNITIFNGDKSKVTLFGESAGAVSLAMLFLNSNLGRFARAVIFESGSPSATSMFDSAHRQSDWDNFVCAVPGCAGSLQTSDSIVCLQRVNSSAILTASTLAWAESNEPFPWQPTIDGPIGLIPAHPFSLIAEGKFTRLPFIAGTNLNEGTYFATPLVNSTNMIRSYLIANYTSPTVPAQQLSSAIEELLELYPDIPALGAPFNTGNDTFGLSSQWKRFAAIMGDLLFISERCAWIQAASERGVKTFGYLFDDPGAQPIAAPNFSAPPPPQGTLDEIPYVYGIVPLFGGTAAAVNLSTHMIDYWVSFAMSLDPNDGLGSNQMLFPDIYDHHPTDDHFQGPAWSQYTCDDQHLLQLNSVNLTMIPDDYRVEQMGFINSHAEVFSL
ncbi:esterase 1 [Mycena maculata]|uniref:Esterase 1 n=1 Tax=Mycena maculata TaxID=230809 RepID=A0AAD7HVZ7_9AGAR|nr:esterase 1 [Mycena maculata]